MLEDLTCTDEKTVKDAEEKIDKFLAETKAEEAKEFVQIRTGVDKTAINKDKLEEVIKKANEYKEMGNEAFKQGQYKKAEELYTSALMIKDDNHMLYTNRAQALIKTGKYYDAAHDCRRAIKLKPEFIKAYIHLGENQVKCCIIYSGKGSICSILLLGGQYLGNRKTKFI